MYVLVYCFKLDEFEFNLKSKYKNTRLLYQGIQELRVQYICELQIIKNSLYIKLTTILTFY